MAFDAVPPTWATTGMITRAVDYAVTECAMRVGRHNRQAPGAVLTRDARWWGHAAGQGEGPNHQLKS